MAITAILADDEPELRAHLRRRLSALWPELVIAGEAENGLEVVQLIEKLRPAVAFLDIRMPGLSGLDVARKISGDSRIVFVTAYDQYAVEAFDQAAVDYLVKPVTDERLSRTIGRLKERLGGDADKPDMAAVLDQLQSFMSSRPASRSCLQWITAGLGGDIRLVSVEEVCYLKAEDKYTTVACQDGSDLVIRTSIKQLENELDPAMFWRIHRSIIVNARQILKASRTFSGGYELRLKSRAERLTASRTYAHLFRQM